MDDVRNLVFSGSDLQEFGASYSGVAAKLPLEIKRRLSDIFRSYSLAYGFEGAFERMKGRTVAQVLDEYKEPDPPPVIAEGQLEGVRYRLYDAPPPDDNKPN
jgi:hypothetical protein